MTTSTSAVPAVIRRVTRAATMAIAVPVAVLVAVSGPARVPVRGPVTGTVGPAPAPGAAAVVTPAYRLVGATTGHAWKGHPGRWIRPYVVRRGDTATGLAVRFHAWTAELLAVNHLTARSTLYVGRRLKIPVVLAALRRSRHHHTAPHKTHHPAPHKTHHRAHRRNPHSPWATGPAATRAAVRRAVVVAARRHHVGPNLALAVAWQESGWQQRRISTAHAIGVMQVLPSTGRWVSSVLGRRLDLYRLHDNVTAGVYLLHLLHSATPRHALADYYQGSGSVHAHGRYPSTRHYIAAVIALRNRLRHGWSPEK